jgi:hypothetical protein
MPPELVETEVELRLNGDWTRPPEPNRPSGSLDDPAGRARVLWEHSRSLALAGERSSAARYARDALALLDYADDRRHLDT